MKPVNLVETVSADTGKNSVTLLFGSADELGRGIHMHAAKSGWALLNRVLSSRLGWFALFLAVVLVDAIRGRFNAGLLVPGVVMSGLFGPYFWFTIKGML